MLRSSTWLARIHHARSNLGVCIHCWTVLRCARFQKPFSTSSHHFKKQKPQDAHKSGQRLPESEKVDIRWFEQQYPWSTKRVHKDPNDPDDDEDWIRRLIEKDEADLREYEQPKGKTMIEPLLAILPGNDAQRIRAGIEKLDMEDERKEKKLSAIRERLEESLPKREGFEINLEIATEQETHLKTLNERIFKTSRAIADHSLSKELWQTYIRCKAFLPPFLHLVPKPSWEVLWASQHAAGPDDLLWAPHVITLSEDMIKAGRSLDVYKQRLYIEALRRQHDWDKALIQWQELKDKIGDDRRAIEEYELLGVRLFASKNDPDKAEKIALNFLGTKDQEGSRILIPILHAWAQRGDDTGIQHAWALYLQFRTHVGDRITMDDYDNISIAFLNIGRTDIALAVFKDMMLTGKETDYTSVELYRKSLAMIGRAQSSAITVDDLNKISLTALTILPRRYQNKFFYGSWLKKLIGAGELDAAIQVVNLMNERGVKPDPKHLNGIIGALLRSGRDDNKEAAEKMAWAMIHERLDFVEKRRRGLEAQSSQISTTSLGTPMPLHPRRVVAPANIETFSLLLLHYGRRAKYELVEEIKRSLKMAEIRPNSYFINHLMYIDLRQGHHQAAWIKYQQMFDFHKPDLETFACLWDCEKAHLENLLVHHRDQFPNPRRIMSEMMMWFQSLSRRPGIRESVREEVSRAFYEQIIRCMANSLDLEGTLVALYALRDTFGCYPNADTNRNVIHSISRMTKGSIGDGSPAGGRRRPRRADRKANADKITQVFALVTRQRDKLLAKRRLAHLLYLDDLVEGEESLYKLAEFIRVVLRMTSDDPESVERNVERTAWDMGVGGIRMEDPLPSYSARTERYRVRD